MITLYFSQDLFDTTSPGRTMAHEKANAQIMQLKKSFRIDFIIEFSFKV